MTRKTSSGSFVLDANVVISAFLFPGSKPGLAVKKAFNTGKVVSSLETLEELKAKLLSDKFDKYAPYSIRGIFLTHLEKMIKFTEVKTALKVCRDPRDDKYLSLAKASKAEAIITGDRDLLILHPYESIAIITPADFLKL